MVDHASVTGARPRTPSTLPVHAPELFEGKFRRRRTALQRRRAVVRAVDVRRQRALVAAARLWQKARNR